jgi:hypothetical protein
MKTLEKINAQVGPHVMVKRYRNRRRFAGANYVVKVQTSSPQTMRDGSFWDGWETVGHYRFIKDAAGAALDEFND